jgi:hypothetical protein
LLLPRVRDQQPTTFGSSSALHAKGCSLPEGQIIPLERITAVERILATPPAPLGPGSQGGGGSSWTRTKKTRIRKPLTTPTLFGTIHLLLVNTLISLEATNMNTLYTFGYGGKKVEELVQLQKKHNAVVVDARFKPYSRNFVWNQKRLIAALGAQNYIWMQGLGNENYKGGPIKFHDFDKDSKQVLALLQECNVIMICVCKNVHKCHRYNAAQKLQDIEAGLQVVHIDHEHAEAEHWVQKSFL